MATAGKKLLGEGVATTAGKSPARSPAAAMKKTAVERVSAAFRACLPRLRGLRSQAIHGDCHASNLLVDGESVCGILDFGDMIHAPLMFEPAIAMAGMRAASHAICTYKTNFGLPSAASMLTKSWLTTKISP